MLTIVGLVAAGLGIALLGLLHVLPRTYDISAVEDTISEYAFTSHEWLFDVAVLCVAAGSVALFGTLIRRGIVDRFSVTSIAAGLWAVGLVLIVAFDKTNWDVGPSTTGTIHRVASVVAFLALPLAVLAGARAVFRDAAVPRMLAQALAVASLLWFAVILGAVFRMMLGGPPWWEALPLGLVERGMALTEMLAISVLAGGLLRTERA